MQNFRSRSHRFTVILKAVIGHNNQKLINSALNALLGQLKHQCGFNEYVNTF